jgi:hypothetical protein
VFEKVNTGGVSRGTLLVGVGVGVGVAGDGAIVGIEEDNPLPGAMKNTDGWNCG